MRYALPASLLLVATAACGADDAPTDIDAAVGADAAASDGQPAVDATGADAAADAPAGVLALTSTAIVEGGTIADLYSCQGANVSPPLAWSGGPAAQGYAVVLTDLNNMLIHSAIWDIPASVSSLAENIAKVAEPAVPAGAKQPLAYDNQTRGYLGPCPGSTHTYQFKVYALDVYPLPMPVNTTTATATRAQIRTALEAHDLATATLTATFTP